MKRILFISALSATIISCGVGNKNVLNTVEGIANIKSIVTENFGNKEVYQLSLYATQELSSELGSITVNYLENGKDYSQLYSTLIPDKSLQEPKESSTQDEFFLKSKQGKINVSDFDFDLISKKYEEASKMIEGYENFQLYNWIYSVDNDNNITANFTIHATQIGEDAERSGRMEITNYYEFEFNVDSDGQLTIDED